MSDEDIERVLEAMVPELRTALKGVLGGESVHAFDCAAGTHSLTGIKTKLVCVVAHEAAAIVLESTARGIQMANEFLQGQSKVVMERLRRAGEKG